MQELIDHLEQNPLENQCSQCHKFVNHTQCQPYFAGGYMCKTCLSKIKIKFAKDMKSKARQETWPN